MTQPEAAEVQPAYTLRILARVAPVAVLRLIVRQLDCHSILSLLRACQELLQYTVLIRSDQDIGHSGHIFKKFECKQMTLRELLRANSQLGKKTTPPEKKFIQLFEVRHIHNTTKGQIDTDIFYAHIREVLTDTSFIHFQGPLGQMTLMGLDESPSAFSPTKLNGAKLVFEWCWDDHSTGIIKKRVSRYGPFGKYMGKLVNTGVKSYHKMNKVSDLVYRAIDISQFSVNRLQTVEIGGVQVVEKLHFRNVLTLDIHFYDDGQDNIPVVCDIFAPRLYSFKIKYAARLPLVFRVDVGTNQQSKGTNFMVMNTNATDPKVLVSDDTTMPDDYIQMDYDFVREFKSVLFVGVPDFLVEACDFEKMVRLCWYKTVHYVFDTELTCTPATSLTYMPALKEFLFFTSVPKCFLPKLMLGGRMKRFQVCSTAPEMNLNGNIRRACHHDDDIRDLIISVVCQLSRRKVGRKDSHIMLTLADLEALVKRPKITFLILHGCLFGPANCLMGDVVLPGVCPLPANMASIDTTTIMSLKFVREKKSSRDIHPHEDDLQCYVFGLMSRRIKTLVVSQAVGSRRYRNWKSITVALPSYVPQNKFDKPIRTQTTQNTIEEFDCAPLEDLTTSLYFPQTFVEYAS